MTNFEEEEIDEGPTTLWKCFYQNDPKSIDGWKSLPETCNKANHLGEFLNKERCCVPWKLQTFIKSLFNNT